MIRIDGKRPKRNKEKHAAVVIPCLDVHTGSWSRFAVVTINGNMRWQSVSQCDTKEEAMAYARKLRRHWKRLGYIQVCNHLKP